MAYLKKKMLLIRETFVVVLDLKARILFL